MKGYVKIKLHYYDDNETELVESLWAKQQNENYIIENSPFYALNFSLGDLVSAKTINGELFIDSLVEESGNSNLQVVFFKREFVQKVRDELKLLGCNSELSDKPQLIAVNVPKEIDYFGVIKPFLDNYSNNEILDYGESCLAHSLES